MAKQNGACLLLLIAVISCASCAHLIDEVRQDSNKKKKAEAEKSQRKLPVRFDWSCEPSSPTELSCHLSSIDARTLCGRITLYCPDGPHTHRGCTWVNKKKARKVRVKTFNPPVTDAYACTRIRFTWQETPANRAITPESKRFQRRAEKQRQTKYLEERARAAKRCEPSWRKRRRAQTPTEQSRAYVAMSEYCRELYWEEVQCEDIANKLRATNDPNERATIMKKAPPACQPMLSDQAQ